MSKNTARPATAEQPKAQAVVTDASKLISELQGDANCDFRTELKDVVVESTTEIDVGAGKKALLVSLPFRSFRSVRGVQPKLVRELEKKARRHVIVHAKRTMIDKDFKRKGLSTRPRSRTLTAVHEALLDDIIAPHQISAKTTRISTDGHRVMTVVIDAKGKDRAVAQEKLDTYAAAYLKLANKHAVFQLEQ